MTADPSIKELYDKRQSIKSAASSLLMDTTWPTESKKAADALRQTVNDLPDFPPNASVTPLKETLMEFIRVLEGAHTRIEDASEKYGKGKRGPFGAVRAKLSSGHRRRCTDTLWGCRAEIESASGELRNCLSQISTGGSSAGSCCLTKETDTTTGNTTTGPSQDSESPSELRLQLTTRLLEAGSSSEPSEAPQTSQTKAEKQTAAPEHPEAQPATLQGSSSGPAEDGERRASTRSAGGNAPAGPVQDSESSCELLPHLTTRLVEVYRSTELSEAPQTTQTKAERRTAASEHPAAEPATLQDSSSVPAENGEKRPSIRDRVLNVARKTFKTVEAGSEAIPVVGDFLGVAAKVGLAFVDMIETMDSNEDVSKQLADHTEELSLQLEHFKKNVDAETEDQVAARVEKLRKELERVQVKVQKWNASGLFKKLLFASDDAEEFRANQDTVQNALERMQLLVSLKTIDIVVELNRIGLLDRLGDGSYGARGNAIEDVICLPGTRVEILSRIDEWIRDTPTSENRVLWIRGMAGRGKSTIASTVAHNWGSKGSCAIFHFRRGQHVQEDRFICALARQLGKSLVPEVKKAILDCVRKNEDIAKERLEQQFKTLFVGSLGNIQNHAHPILIIVDALDECRNVNDAVRFVRLITQYSTSLPANVKFLLTCRPEPPLVLALELGKWRAEDLDLTSHVDEDIRRLIQHACKRIREEHDLPQSWPSSPNLEAIVRMSQGLFQWARTAIAYISKRAPDDRLQELLRDPSKWTGLDELYHQILSKAFEEVESDEKRKEMLSWVLGALVVAPYPVTLEIIALLHAEHKLFEGQDFVRFLRNDILADLNSLLHIPKVTSEPVRLMHTSIRDLLIHQKRCENRSYSVDPRQHHVRLATVSLGIMQRDLKHNICNLSRIPNANSEFQAVIDRNVPSGLRYCCRSWATHVVAGVVLPGAPGETRSAGLDRFKRFSDEKILSWLEVMSLIGAASEAYTIAKQVTEWLLNWPADISDDSLNTLWNDTRRFITGFFELISSNALGIYSAALPRCPVVTKLWLKYHGQATAWMLVGKQQNWSAHIWTASAASRVSSIVFSPNGRAVASGSGSFGRLEGGVVQLWDVQTGAPLGHPLTGHSNKITSVVFSPNGKVLASGSIDNTVRLWDARTGASLGKPLTGHHSPITSVVFSPDGKVLASGSDDRTVRLWDAQTGVPLGSPLTGHSGWITSVVFSPDGKVLASGSGDKTVRLWDAQTGAPVRIPLNGHSLGIISVVFSPDGNVLASGSHDETVRLWDAQTGAPLGKPLTGHSDLIRSAVFSPDGKVLASGSYDKTVRLWEAQTGALLGEPLTGHSDSITSIVFSPDGKILASGSYDKTVQLWNAKTGAPLGDPLTGHSDSITSVVFSPDGKVLASGSYDKTVRLWDAQTGAQVGNLLTGHSYWIRSVVFSPDGKVLASGSSDMTARLWDAQTGAPLGEPLTGHCDSISSLVFSPDYKVLASGSYDKTVRLWDAQNGEPLGDPLAGHSDSITSVVFSPDGKVLASGSYDNTIRLWVAQTRAPLGNPLTGHDGPVTSVVFSPDGKVLASGSGDKTVRLWDVKTRALVGNPLTGHSDSIRSVVFSPDGKVLASGSSDMTAQLWNTQTGAPLGDPLIGHSGSIDSVVFSPDGKVLASGSYDKTVQLWDAQTGAPLGEPLTGHRRSIISVMFSPDGKVLASSSHDGMVRFWDPLTHKPLLAHRPFDLLTY